MASERNDKWMRLATVGVAAVSVTWACTDPLTEEGGPTIDFDRRALLRSVADHVVVPTVDEFATTADNLRTAVQAHADALAGGGDGTDTLEAARTAWRDAMTAWQRADAMRIGPAGASITAIGGEDLGDEIYSWPTSNPCLVDQALVEGDYESADFFDTALVNVYGLDALEYLLFVDGPDNACPAQLPINAGPWAALDETELARRRADFAAVVADGLAGDAHALADAWNGDFAGYLAAPGEGGSPYDDEAVAVDELMRAIFYIDVMLKDVKLGRPSGVSDCAADTCPDALESPWAGHDKASALANLQGLRLMYLGGPTPEEGTGFDDFLVAAGDPDLAATMLADIDAAIASIDAMEGSFADTLAVDAAALDAPYAAVKKVTDHLKGPFATTLQLMVPSEAAGDAD